jgi:hypothetical protein
MSWRRRVALLSFSVLALVAVPPVKAEQVACETACLNDYRFCMQYGDPDTCLFLLQRCLNKCPW